MNAQSEYSIKMLSKQGQVILTTQVLSSLECLNLFRPVINDLGVPDSFCKQGPAVELIEDSITTNSYCNTIYLNDILPNLTSEWNFEFCFQRSWLIGIYQ